MIDEHRSARPVMGIFDGVLEKFGGRIDFAIQTGDFIFEDKPSWSHIPIRKSPFNFSTAAPVICCIRNQL